MNKKRKKTKLPLDYQVENFFKKVLILNNRLTGDKSLNIENMDFKTLSYEGMKQYEELITSFKKKYNKRNNQLNRKESKNFSKNKNMTKKTSTNKYEPYINDKMNYNTVDNCNLHDRSSKRKVNFSKNNKDKLITKDIQYNTTSKESLNKVYMDDKCGNDFQYNINEKYNNDYYYTKNNKISNNKIGNKEKLSINNKMTKYYNDIKNFNNSLWKNENDLYMSKNDDFKFYENKPKGNNRKIKVDHSRNNNYKNFNKINNNFTDNYIYVNSLELNNIEKFSLNNNNFNSDKNRTSNEIPNKKAKNRWMKPKTNISLYSKNHYQKCHANHKYCLNW